MTRGASRGHQRHAGLAAGDAALLRQPGHGARLVQSLGEARCRPCPAGRARRGPRRRGRPPPTLRTTSCSARPIVEVRRGCPGRARCPPAFMPDARRQRPGDDDGRPGRIGRGDQAVQRELLGARRLHGGEHDRQASSGQPAMTALIGDLLDGRGSAVGRDHADDLLRVARGVLEHRHDALGRGRDDRQAVGEPALDAAPRRGPRARRRSMRARRGCGPRARARRAASRAATSGSRVRHAHPGRISGRPSRSSCAPAARGELGQPRAVQALDAAALLAAVEQQSAGTASGSKRADSSRSVVELGDARAARARRACAAVSSGVGLGELTARRPPRGVERRQDLVADRAVVLDEREQFGHARRL